MRVFNDSEVTLVEEDPSPRGINHLPPGRELYAYCPHCGDDDLEFDFSLVDELDIEEGDEAIEAKISYNGKTLLLYVDEDGALQFGWSRPSESSEREKHSSLGERRSA